MTDPTSYTTWNRLSPSTRNDAMNEGLKAKVADPLWLLGRQWQVGELTGDDAGSPVRVECWYEHDPMTRVDLAPETDAATARDYDVEADGPLETIVEREAILPDEPDRETAVETGRNFLSRLDRRGVRIDGRPPRATDFDSSLLVDDTDGPVDAGGERYLSVVEGRALDGASLYAQLTARGDVASASDWQSVSWRTVDHGYPGSSVPDGYKQAVKSYVDWYSDLYDEPDGDETAWNTDRMEYEFAAATGSGSDETAFMADEYTGGRLDRNAFSLDPDRTLDPDQGSTGDQTDTTPATGAGTDITTAAEQLPIADLAVDRSEPDMTMVPSKVSFPGMPSHRWWEFEDGSVNLDEMQVGPGEVGKLLLAEFATLYGNDWFSFSIDVPVGSLTRIEELVVTDTFGQVISVDATTATESGSAVSAEMTDQSEEADEGALGGAAATAGRWNMFMYPDLPNHDDPGLLYPPVLAKHHRSDPVERVLFARDELANMAFGVELVAEDAIGDPLRRREFTPATLAVDTVRTADAADDEWIRLTNPGESSVGIGGWVVEADTGPSYQFPTDTTVGPTESVTLRTGGTDADPLHWGRSNPVWTDAAELTIRTAPQGPIVTKQLLDTSQSLDESASQGVPDYRLVSDIADYWFPLRMQSTGIDEGSGIGDLRFELARLLDADAEIAEPHGRILDPDLRLHDEELTRAGTAVTRSYQYARWIGGTAHLWSGRETSLGRGEGQSGLRFDYLRTPDLDHADGE